MAKLNNPNTSELTPKQLHFCRCVASGMKQAAAYREAFDCQAGSLNKTQQESASRLMSKPKIAARVDALVRQRERGMIASTLSDKESVLEVLRDKMRNADSDSNKLRAAELLGRTVGIFKADQDQDSKPQTTAELQAELQELLGQVLDCDGAGKEPALDAVH